MTDAIVWLDAPGAPERRIGGKGGSLARLSGLGFPVPPGFVVAAEAYEAFAESHDLAAATAPLAGLDPRMPMAAIREALAPVAERLEGAKLWTTAREALLPGQSRELKERAGAARDLRRALQQPERGQRG